MTPFPFLKCYNSEENWIVCRHSKGNYLWEVCCNVWLKSGILVTLLPSDETRRTEQPFLAKWTINCTWRNLQSSPDNKLQEWFLVVVEKLLSFLQIVVRTIWTFTWRKPTMYFSPLNLDRLGGVVMGRILNGTCWLLKPICILDT